MKIILNLKFLTYSQFSRIISPSEVQLRKQTECPRRRGRPKKVQSDEVDGAPPPKKLFPRTRSGRLSRPPKHMVRDYKHIRRPGANDSDGGYSDYQSDNEMDVLQNINTSPVELLPGKFSYNQNSILTWSVYIHIVGFRNT